MASAWYTQGLKHFALGDVVWKNAAGSTINCTLVDAADYTVDVATHEYMNTNTVPAASKVKTGAMTLTDAANGGILDATDVVLSAVTGDPTELVLVWLDGGDGGTTAAGVISFLLMSLEASVTPNGGDITVTWDDGANKIAKL